MNRALAFITAISPLWQILLPLAVAGALWARYWPLRRAVQIGLIRPRAFRLLRLALACGGSFMLLSGVSIFHETAIWPPALATGLAVAMALLLRAARVGVHPGLHGLHWPIPRDGLELVERERLLDAGRAPWGWWLWRLGPIAPLVALLSLAAMPNMQRWPLWLALAASLFAPILLVAYRQAWVGPLALLLVSSTLGWQAAELRGRLPPGRWRTPWTAAPCSAPVVLAGDHTAWCFDRTTDVAYHFSLANGQVVEHYQVANGSRIFAANGNGAWVRGNPSSVLSYVHAGQIEVREFYHPISGTLTADDTLWLVDGLEQLLVSPSAAGGNRPLASATDDLPGARAKVVEALPDHSIWVGSRLGVSRRNARSASWETFDRTTGLRGTVTDVALAPDGTVWLQQTAQRLDSDLFRQIWWVSALRPDGSWRHIHLGQLTGLGPSPRPQDAIAVDGLGRLWFTAVTPPPFEKYLGILNPDGSLAHLAALGDVLWATGGREIFGLLPDGRGGIYLYNGEDEPLRHWRP